MNNKIASSLLVLVFAGCSWFGPSQKNPPNTNTHVPLNSNTLEENANTVKDNIQTGLIITTPSAQDVITSGVVIRGYVTGEGWTAFEGQVGIVNLLDANGNSIVMAPLQATTNWMQLPVSFEAKLIFPEPETDTGILLFQNENASGMPEYEREYTMPIRFHDNGQATTTINLFFANTTMDPEVTCNKVYPVVRGIPKTETVAYSALSLLFAGPTTEEKKEGFTSLFRSQTKDALQSIKIVNGTAYVNLKDIRSLIPSASSSCGSAQFFASVETTLTQFPTIKKVLYAINRDPQTFYDWVQVGCTAENNNCDATNFQ